MQRTFTQHDEERITGYQVWRQLKGHSKGHKPGDWVPTAQFRNYAKAQSHCRRMTAAGYAMRIEPVTSSTGPALLRAMFRLS